MRYFRLLQNPSHDEKIKREINKIFHREGAARDGLILFALSVFTAAIKGDGLLSSLYFFADTFIALGFTMWTAFDIMMARALDQKWYYLGTTSDTDVKLKQKLGKNAGKIKAIFGLLIVIATTVVYFFL
jgi:hypothetical protein